MLSMRQPSPNSPMSYSETLNWPSAAPTSIALPKRRPAFHSPGRLAGTVPGVTWLMSTRTSRPGLRLLQRRRQVDGEGRALAELGIDGERAAMAVDDVLDDREPEPGAAERARAAGVDAIESLGQPRQVLARDPLPLVGD